MVLDPDAIVLPPFLVLEIVRLSPNSIWASCTGI